MPIDKLAKVGPGFSKMLSIAKP